jgi:hypothetical protein
MFQFVSIPLAVLVRKSWTCLLLERRTLNRFWNRVFPKAGCRVSLIEREFANHSGKQGRKRD